LPAAARWRASEEGKYTSWDRARLSVVVPIGIIVAVAIICIVVAVLSSAERADTVAIQHEQQMLAGALRRNGEHVLRQVESIAASPSAVVHISDKFDPAWASRRVGQWLETFFDHDAVFILDGNDRPLYALVNHQAAAPAWFNSVRPEVGPILDFLRGRSVTLNGGIPLGASDKHDNNARAHAAIIGRFLGHPAVIAAAAVGATSTPAAALGRHAPILVSVKFIERKLLADIAAQLNLTHLRVIGDELPPSGNHGYTLADSQGREIARFAWQPKQPGAEIVNSVIPFIAVAFAGFVLLAAFVLRYMRRTAVAIATGELRLRHLAMHDPLCGLPNRIFFGERLEAVIEKVRVGSSPAAVYYIDLDHFKDVNDTLGHHIGDELIRNVTLRLSHVLRGDDLVARLGGDEFAVLTSIGDDHAALMTVAQRIITAICAPYGINEQTILIGASIGIAIVDKNSGGAADIMRYADMALYRAKNEGRNRACVYDAAMDADLSNRKLLEADLREAIENNRLQLLYQPIVNKSGVRLVGVEALCRWTHPVRGPIEPSEFIAAAEHSGLIIPLGEWVLRRALIDAKAWPELTVAVNVSPLQFRRADFVEAVERILAETEFDTARLELELTETVLLGNMDSAETAMQRLKTLGVKLALDDFGTGYSSLLYLRRYPFDKLKIDRSFVRSIEKAADAAAIVHAVVSLGRGLGMQVTAEGVETADQQLFLRAAGVHSMQGFRFGKAMHVSDIVARLKSPDGLRTYDTPTALAS